ncbi:hypothetical protein WOC76_09375 [Methylocystis sp. IM3]|uniref:hypothetical protein n=1 Tax=unclassified Methylocystis TaxID=2625913 RepID=UPI0030F7F388
MTKLLKQPNVATEEIDYRAILSQIQANALNRDIDDYANTLHHLRVKQHRNLLLNQHTKRRKLRQALADDVANWNCTWDIDLALTLPRSHPAAHASSPAPLVNLLRRYFTAVDARVFPNQSRKHRQQLHRFVVIEHAEGVGWHMHGLVASPSHIDIVATNNILRSQWYQAIGEITDERMDSRRYYWSDIHQDDYIHYCLKHVIQTNNSEIDISKGTICWRNTVRPASAA